MADFPAGSYASRAALEGIADANPTRPTLQFAQARGFKMRGLKADGTHLYWMTYSASPDPVPPGGVAVTLVTFVELF